MTQHNKVQFTEINGALEAEATVKAGSPLAIALAGNFEAQNQALELINQIKNKAVNGAYEKCAEIARDNKKTVVDLFPTADTTIPSSEMAGLVAIKNYYNESSKDIATQITKLIETEE